MAEPWSLFPGVYTELVDTSFGVAASAGSTGFIVFMSEKGPDNQLMLNSRVDELLSTYGTVDITSYGQGLKIAIQYLRYSTSLYSIRVTPDHTNVPAMSNIYNDLYGKFYKSQIEIREAAYANIGIATNESGEFEFVHVGPENLGTIIAIDTLTPPDNPKVNDRYYIPAVDPNTGRTAEATGKWKGHEGELAICLSESPVVWSFKEIKDTSLAQMNGVSMCAAVTYEALDPLALWREYENVYMKEGTYASVIDIIDTLPTEDPQDDDAYFISDNPVDLELANHKNQVLRYSAMLDEWSFEKYNKVFVERDYIFANEPETTSIAVGDRYIVDYETTYSDWVGHEGEIAEKTSSGWKFLTFDVGDPEDTDKFQSLVINKYDTNDPLITTRMEFSKKNIFVKDIIWTSDTNAAFCAYAHRMNQFDDIISNANPDKSIDNESIEPFVMFYPIGRGSYYNGMRVNMKLSSRSIHEESDFDKVLVLDIYDTSGGNILKVESFEVSFNPNKKNLDGASMFIEDVLNTYSNYLRCAINREIFVDTAMFTQNIHSDIEMLFTKYSLRNKSGSTALPPALQHGDDGNIFDKYGNLDWNVAQQILVKAYTGQIINPAARDQGNPYETSVLDREMILFDLIFDAGYPGPVKTSIQTLIEARHQDCFGVIDLGDNASAKAAYEARTSEGGVGVGFNTPFIAIYEPYSLVYDGAPFHDMFELLPKVA